MKDLKPKLGAASPLGAKTKGKFEVAPRKTKDSASQQDGDKQKVFFLPRHYLLNVILTML